MTDTAVPTGVPCHVLNLQSGTSVDLWAADPGKDAIAVKGFPMHYGQNQQWIFQRGSVGYTIKSAVPFGTYYLGYRPEGEEDVGEGTGVIGTANPVEYRIEGDPRTGFSFLVAKENLPYLLELDRGLPEADVLFGKPNATPKQKWMILPLQDYTSHEFKPTYKNLPFDVKGSRRLRSTLADVCLDSGAEDGSLTIYGTFYHDNQKWTLVPATTGYFLKTPGGKYVAVESPSVLKMRAVGTEFLLEGTKAGYYIVDATNPSFAFELDQGSVVSKTKVVLKPGRRHKWILQGY
ncbi:hypothetical protein FS749_005517 [Ceratobasidium sp. UAMH 11750]|nr:hypothetical protein FS749_005517 [Ceratobasidium sp. UAMH 11750]